MKRLGAASILSTMLIGFLSWVALSVVGNSTDIARLQVREATNHEMLKEIRTSVKEITKLLIKRR